jgi:hypothetical protein
MFSPLHRLLKTETPPCHDLTIFQKPIKLLKTEVYRPQISIKEIYEARMSGLSASFHNHVPLGSCSLLSTLALKK